MTIEATLTLRDRSLQTYMVNSNSSSHVDSTILPILISSSALSTYDIHGFPHFFVNNLLRCFEQ